MWLLLTRAQGPRRAAVGAARSGSVSSGNRNDDERVEVRTRARRRPRRTSQPWWWRDPVHRQYHAAAGVRAARDRAAIQRLHVFHFVALTSGQHAREIDRDRPTARPVVDHDGGAAALILV